MFKAAKLRLYFTFYLSFFFATILLSLCCYYLLHVYGVKTLVPIVWFKLITFGIIMLYINQYKSHEFYYYQNLGISKVKLWAFTIGFDLLLFVLLLMIS
jgi:hypothetical protein